MKLTDIVRNVAADALYKPGSVIEVMVGDPFIKKGTKFIIDNAEMLIERGLKWLPVEGPERGLNPSCCRLAKG